MDVRNIGQSAIAVFIEGSELREHNIEADNIDLKQAASLLETAGWEVTEFEIFAGRDSVLLFAWEKPTSPHSFEFDNIEDMLSAAIQCPPDYSSKLIYDGIRYILTVYTAREEPPCPALFEYGWPLELSEEYLLHLYEQYVPIILSGAVDKLKSMAV